jgi:tetratricopeptide (TPR) repeat protein
VQDEITERVVATVGSVYGVISRARFAEVKKRPTDHLDAYDCVAQVGAYYRSNYDAGKHAEIRDALERAVQADPAYADAWAYLSIVYLDEYRANYNPRPDPLDRALHAARQAVASDPTSQSAHYALANVYFSLHELDAFFAEAERAIELNPNNGGVLGGLGSRLYDAGDDQGIVLVRRAMKLDPFHPWWLRFPIADHHFQRGDYKEALATVRKIDMPGHLWTPVYLAGIYAELGREREAQSAVEEILRLYPGFTTEAMVKELRKWNRPDDVISRWTAALRKAGLPEGTEA